MVLQNFNSMREYFLNKYVGTLTLKAFTETRIKVVHKNVGQGISELILNVLHIRVTF